MNSERKGFDAALAAVTAGVVGTLIVWKLDRLSRKGIGQVGKVLDDIEEAGGRLVSVVDGLDTSNDSARMVVAMLAELARSESKNLGTRVGHAKRYLRSKGQWIGGQPPYGLEEARLADLEDARYVRGEFSGAAAVERYNRLSERLRGRVDGLRGDLHRLPMPSVDVSPMLDGVTLREAWTDATNEDRRERLSLAIILLPGNPGL